MGRRRSIRKPLVSADQEWCVHEFKIGKGAKLVKLIFENNWAPTTAAHYCILTLSSNAVDQAAAYDATIPGMLLYDKMGFKVITSGGNIYWNRKEYDIEHIDTPKNGSIHFTSYVSNGHGQKIAAILVYEEPDD